MFVKGKVNAGFAAVDITPALGTHLAGSGAGVHRPARKVLDPLYAKAAVFTDGTRRLVIVELDVTIITSKYADKIAAGIMEALNIPREWVMVMGTQTHSAPGVGYFNIDDDYPLDIPDEREYIRGSEKAYSDFAAESAIKAAIEADKNIKPMNFETRRAMKRGLAFNRRIICRVDQEDTIDTEVSYKVGIAWKKGDVIMPFPMDNTSENNPLGPDYMSHEEGPIDNEVLATFFTDFDGNMVSAILHFTCHPVNAYCNPDTYDDVSADWPGCWANQVSKEYKMSQLPLVINGCCGNTNPIDPYEADMVTDAEKMASQLTEVTEKMVKVMKDDAEKASSEDGIYQSNFEFCARLDAKLEWIPINYREMPQWRIDQCKEILGDDISKPKYAPDGSLDVDWFFAASSHGVTLEMKREPVFMYPVQVFRIGDLAIVGLAGEPFSEGQLRLKMESPAPITMVGHMANKYVGYIPVKEGCDRGGLEAHPLHTYWNKLERDALDKIVDKSVEILDTMWYNRA